jgi:hypothetical protein
MNRGTIYVERANGSYEAWTYVDGDRIYIGRFTFLDDVYIHYSARKWRIVRVDA